MNNRFFPQFKKHMGGLDGGETKSHLLCLQLNREAYMFFSLWQCGKGERQEAGQELRKCMASHGRQAQSPHAKRGNEAKSSSRTQ